MAHPAHRWMMAPGAPPDLSRSATRSRAGAPGKKGATQVASAKLVEELAELQGRLWAEQERSVLVILQALDAGGKDGTVRRVFSGVNPQGVRVWSFKEPTEEERRHDFLWRIHRRVPAAGEIGVFNRSHYEDVLIARVDELVPESVWRPRYEAIRSFERTLSEAGTTIVKVFLHISKEEQAKRFGARLDDPRKRWKFTAADLAVRSKWDRYQEAYTDVLGETGTVEAPWYVVPADRKWYRDWAVLEILVRTLRGLDPRFPDAEAGIDEVTIE